MFDFLKPEPNSSSTKVTSNTQKTTNVSVGSLSLGNIYNHIYTSPYGRYGFPYLQALGEGIKSWKFVTSKKYINRMVGMTFDNNGKPMGQQYIQMSENQYAMFQNGNSMLNHLLASKTNMFNIQELIELADFIKRIHEQFGVDFLEDNPDHR